MFAIDLPRAVVGFMGVHLGLRAEVVLDTAPDGAFDTAWEQVPPSLRLVHRAWWKRCYERAFGSYGTRPPPALPTGLAAAA